jgi:hypothetical protein
MDFINPTAPKTKDYVREARNENQKERIASYRPTIDKQLANLFTQSIPNEKNTPTTSIVDWSFLDKDDDQTS